MKKYLFWFANEHVDFRFNEIQSLVKLFGISVKYIERCPVPWWIVEVEKEEHVKLIASRSVSLRYAIHLWASADSLTKLHDKIKSLPDSFMDPYSSPDVSFKIKVETFLSSQTQVEKVEKIETFNYLPLKGQVKLKNPNLTLHYIEYYGLDDMKPSAEPKNVFFGRLICEGQRDLITTLSLKKRKFIGNTSMDPQLSLLMANQALVKPNDIVLDPFVGTGSLLIAAAQFGAYVFGSDIDYLTIHGKSRPTRKQMRHKPRCGENILSNLEQYGLASRYLDVIVADSSLPLWTSKLLLDAIITDPPYGMRESTERLGANKEVGRIMAHHLPTHIPCKVHYCLEALISDLLQFASTYLRINGRLVFWMPIIRNEYSEDNLPSHPSLQLVGNSEQILSTASSRRLLTYEKIHDIQDTSNSTPVKTEESFREKYYKQVEGVRKEKRLKAFLNPQYVEKLLESI